MPRTAAHRRIDTHRRDRANNRVRRTTQVSVALAAASTGALVGLAANAVAAAKPVPHTPAGPGSAHHGATGTSTGRTAGDTPSPASGRSPSATAPAVTAPSVTAPSVTAPRVTAPPTTIPPPPPIVSGGS